MSGPKPRPLLPASLRKRVLEAFHGLDHCGQKALLRRTSAEYYWPKQNAQIKDFKRNCHFCQAAQCTYWKANPYAHQSDSSSQASILPHQLGHPGAIAQVQRLPLHADHCLQINQIRSSCTLGSCRCSILHQGFSSSLAGLLLIAISGHQ